MDIPQANIIQSGNQHMSFNGESRFNENMNMPDLKMPELIEPSTFDNNQNMPDIVEPDFITERYENGINVVGNNIQPSNESLVKSEEDFVDMFEDRPVIKSKYNIIDLFWLVDDQVFADISKLDQDQAHFMSIGYNMDFGNLRVTLCKLTKESIDNHVVYRQSMQTLVSGTIYPSSAFRILNSSESKVVCIEQLINRTGEKWQEERPTVQINTKDNYECLITDPLSSRTYKYTFNEWQTKAFKHSLEYTFEQGLQLRGKACLMKK